MEWPKAQLADLCEVFTDGDWIESKSQSPEGVRLIQTGNVGEGNFKDRRDKSRFISEEAFDELKCCEIFEGDCLVSRLPDPVGRSCILPKSEDRMITAVDCTILRFKKDKLIPEFFNYFSQSSLYLNKVESLTSGATRKRISRKNLGLVDIPRPPIPEQKRIVAILDQAFADIEQARAKTEQNLKNARELFGSYLQQVFSQRGEGWEIKNISEVAETCLGKMLDKKKNKGSPKPYLRNQNVQWFEINTDDLLEMRFEDSEYERYAIKKGDLVICEGGYPGRGAIWERDEDIFFQKALHRIRCHNPLYNRWVLYYLYLSDCNGTLKNSFTGAGIQHFTGKSLKQLALPIPPVELTEKFVRNFDELFNHVISLEHVYHNKLNSIDELKKSILQKAFSGELTKEKEGAVA